MCYYVPSRMCRCARLRAYPPTCLSASLHAWQNALLPTYVPTCHCLVGRPRTRASVYIRRRACVRACLSACMIVCVRACVPACLPMLRVCLRSIPPACMPISFTPLVCPPASLPTGLSIFRRLCSSVCPALLANVALCGCLPSYVLAGLHDIGWALLFPSVSLYFSVTLSLSVGVKMLFSALSFCLHNHPCHCCLPGPGRILSWPEIRCFGRRQDIGAIARSIGYQLAQHVDHSNSLMFGLTQQEAETVQVDPDAAVQLLVVRQLEGLAAAGRRVV
eukprot:SAG11_NODE_4263_length_1981_cov_35.759830_4_plen_275_part_01